MRGRRFADAQIEERAHHSGVQDVAGVNEGLGCGAGELREANGGLLRRDEGAGGVDTKIPSEVGQPKRKWIIGRVWRQCGDYPTDFSTYSQEFYALSLTIVDDNARVITQHCLDLRKGTDDGVWIRQVTGDVELIRSAVCFLQLSRDKSGLVALCNEGPSHMLANIGPSTEDENDGSDSRHGNDFE